MATDIKTLELVRKTVFGGPQGGVLDFNSAFNASNHAASGNFESMMQALMPYGKDSGSGPGTNASGEATGGALGIANAIGAMIGSAVTGAVPGASLASTVIASLTGHQNPVSAVNSIQAFMDAISNFSQNSQDHGDDPDTAPNTGVNASTAPGEASAGNAPDAGNGGNGSTGGDSGNGSTGGVAGGNGDSAAGGDFFHGGFVPGPSTGQDKVNINVDGGEVVIPKHIVDMLGHNFFENLLLNTKSPAQEFATKQAATAAKSVKE